MNLRFLPKTLMLLLGFPTFLITSCGMNEISEPSTEVITLIEPSEDMGAAVEIQPETPLSGLTWQEYKVVSGDTISAIATGFDLRTDTLLSVNNITRSRALQIGKLLRIPNQDGILYKVSKETELTDLAEKYEVPTEELALINELEDFKIPVGVELFLPGVRLDSGKLREINGDLFIWPAKGYISSRYGYRKDPFTGSRTFHRALDIAAHLGTPVYAAMEGRVKSTGYESASGNYIILSHHTGYTTLYAHLSVISVEEGQWVNQGKRIGSVGNTGYSTGPHLHFGVQQYGRSLNPLYVLN